VQSSKGHVFNSIESQFITESDSRGRVFGWCGGASVGVNVWRKARIGTKWSGPSNHQCKKSELSAV
jgi:hypothetical protein